MNIYIAGPFFNEQERNQLNKMISFVKTTYPNDNIFIPMEHFVPNGENISNEEWGHAVFEMDVEALNNANLVYALYGGLYSDTGTAWEIGYAYAKHIPTILWCTNKSNTKVSVMPYNSTKHFYNKKYEQK